jgi:hypothetical protein
MVFIAAGFLNQKIYQILDPPHPFLARNFLVTFSFFDPLLILTYTFN